LQEKLFEDETIWIGLRIEPSEELIILLPEIKCVLSLQTNKEYINATLKSDDSCANVDANGDQKP
jgi:hypothetical protein